MARGPWRRNDSTGTIKAWVLSLPTSEAFLIQRSKRERGSLSLPAAIIGLVVLISAVWVYSQLSRSARSLRVYSAHAVEAQLYASELLEFFVSMPQAQLASYLAMNPYYTRTPASERLPEYFLCAHINIRDRVTGVRMNPDDVAELPKGAFNGRWARRYYKIDVVDRTDFKPNDDVCTKKVSEYPLPLYGDEGYWVTVFVEYEDAQDNLKSVIVSSLINEM